MVNVPAGWAPIVVGVRVTPIVQLAPAASVGFKHVDDGLIAYGVPDVTARDEMDREVVWLFVRVTVLMALVWPSTTFPKFNAEGETTVAAMPVPLSATVCGLFGAFVATVRVPVCAPVEVGEKATFTVQLAPAAIVPVVLHVPPDATLKPAEAVIDEMLRPGQLLESVIVLAALVVLITSLPKASELEDSAVATMPVPLSETVCGLFGALVATVRVPGCTPVEVGEKATFIVQLVAAAIVPVVLHVPPDATL
jgi:hypothetical protein